MGNCLSECFYKLLFRNKYQRIDSTPLVQENYFSYTNPIYYRIPPKTRQELLEHYKTLDKFRPSAEVKKLQRKKKLLKKKKKKKKIHTFSIFGKRRVNNTNSKN